MIKKKRLINGVIVICLGILIVISTINSYVIDSTKKKIISLDSVQDKSDYVIVVLGLRVGYRSQILLLTKREYRLRRVCIGLRIFLDMIKF